MSGVKIHRGPYAVCHTETNRNQQKPSVFEALLRLTLCLRPSSAVRSFLCCLDPCQFSTLGLLVSPYQRPKTRPWDHQTSNSDTSFCFILLANLDPPGSTGYDATATIRLRETGQKDSLIDFLMDFALDKRIHTRSLETAINTNETNLFLFWYQKHRILFLSFLHIRYL